MLRIIALQGVRAHENTGTLYLHRDFTGVRGNMNAMKHSIELCLLYVQKTFMNSVQL